MFRSLLAVLIAAVCPVAILAADEVKEIDVKGLKLMRVTGAPKPVEIASAEQLQKAIADKEAADAIAKQVDFAKQKLVYFAWSGSGQDKILAERGKESCRFTFERGRTRDLREHHRMFVLGKDEKWEFGSK